MKALSLFSGIGGIDLACEWAGIETVAMCEREPFCQKVLRKHWPHIPIYDDVCTLSKARLEADGIGTIDIIHGGYPCQPFSYAGKRKGERDDRHLWPEVCRLLQEIGPDWFVGENVAGHISMGLDEVLSDLGNIGYDSQPFIIPAAAVGAPHRRERVFIVANRHNRFDEFTDKTIQTGWASVSNGRKDMADSNSTGRKKQHIAAEPESTRFDTWGAPSGREQWTFEPGVDRVADGVPNRVDRIKALGNAVVPQQIYPILAAVKQIDDMMRAG